MNFGRGMVLSALGFEFVILILAAYYFGQILDEKMGWNNWGTIGLILICFIGWLVRFIVMIKKIVADQAKEASENVDQSSR